MGAVSPQITNTVITLRIPEMHITEDATISIGAKSFNQETHSKQSRIINFFRHNPRGVLKKDELVKIINDEDVKVENPTVRLEKSLWRSSNQILFRLRKNLARSFSDTMPSGTEWLPFSEDHGGWILFRIPGYGSHGQFM